MPMRAQPLLVVIGVCCAVGSLLGCGGTIATEPATSGSASAAASDDLDDLVGAADACPDAPEDEDGFEDQDGCPEVDNDRDRIADVDDLCPCDVEDADGFEDQDGCPDPDNDRDRVNDVCDRCPNDAELYNGTCDEDGCPDRGRVLLVETRLVILDRIAFARQSAAPAPRAQPILEAVAATLAANPQLERVAVVAHVARDERARDALGHARARAVIEALVARGVAAERLEPQLAPPESDTDAAWHGRYVGFVITQVDGVAWPGGEPPEGWGGGSTSPRPAAEPATCEPVSPCPPPEETHAC
ncbi:MAG: hypothetical protein U0353_02940 [Sandaracinus sp.]